MPNQVPSIFRGQPPTVSLPAFDFGAGYIDSIKDINVPDNAITGGQNVEIDLSGKPAKRGGVSLYGQFLGSSTGILGLHNMMSRNGSQERLAVYDTGIYRDVAGTWTLLTGTTFTTNLPTDGAYFPLTDKYYITNGIDNPSKYSAGSSTSDQSDNSFKKGKYINHFQNRLLVSGVANQEDYVWYTDLGVDTFSSNNYFRVVGQITGMITYYDKSLIFTKKTIQRLQNFTFSGTAAGPESVIPLPVEFGSIYERTIRVVNNFVYFLGQDSRKKVDIYQCDGYKAVAIGDDKVRNFLNSLSTSQLQNACAVADGIHYRIQVADSGQTTNTTGILYDTNRSIFYTKIEKFVQGVADFSCFMVSENQGQFEIYAGTQNLGQVYKINQTGSYDELPEERYLALGTYNVPVDANPVKRAAQSFQMHNYPLSQTVPLTQVALYLKKNAGTTTDLTVRIETDSNGSPSGTLVANGSTTIPTFTSTSYSWVMAKFSTAPVLTGSTTYWLVLEHVTEGSGNSQYYWLGNTCTSTYVYGHLAMYATITGTPVTGTFNPGTTAIDGQLSLINAAGTNASFSTIRGAAASTDENTTHGFVVVMQFQADTAANTWKEMERGVFKFDTSSIPDNATITSAHLDLYCTYNYNDNTGLGFNLTSVTTANNNKLTSTDYAVANFGSTKFATDILSSAISVNSYTTFTLNASGQAAINLTGISSFGLRWIHDISNVAPTWGANFVNGVNFQTRNNTNKPRLVVNYTTPSGAATWTSDQVTDQNFVIYSESAIDGYFDTKAFAPTKILSPLTQLNQLPFSLAQRFILQKFYTLFSTSGNYNVQVGFTNGDYDSFKYFLLSLGNTNTANTWGGGGTWGGGNVWGGSQARVGQWTQVDGFSGRTVKARIRNVFPNQPFVFDGIEIVITPKYRQR